VHAGEVNRSIGKEIFVPIHPVFVLWQARGFPGALRFQLFPIHDACRWNAMDELKDIVAGVGDSLCPAVIRDLMDKFWKSDQPYIRTLRSLALATGRKSYLSLLLEEADGDGETPLRLASKHASVHVVRYLVELGASVNAVDVRTAIIHLAFSVCGFQPSCFLVLVCIRVDLEKPLFIELPKLTTLKAFGY
jgi:Ankyrin repeat